MASTSSHKMLLPLLALIGAGLAGNYFACQVFFGVEFLFGSIFAMLVLQFFGLGPGIIAAIAISSISLIKGYYFFDILIMACEVLAVGWLYRRQDFGLVLLDALYWLCLGMPLAYFLGPALVQFQSDNEILITTFTLAINGVANTLLARLVFMALTARQGNFFTLREVMFNLLTIFVLVPSLALMAHESREEFVEIDQEVRKSLAMHTQSLKDSLESWLGQKSSRLVHLAWMQSHALVDIQHDLDFLRSLDADLNAVGIIDKHAISTAFSPRVDELGQSAIGKDFSDRPYLAELKRTLLPQLSEVVVSKLGNPEPIAVMLAPIVDHGVYEGYAAAILNLERVKKVLFLQGTEHGLWCTILDRNHKVIATNRESHRVLEPFSFDDGLLTRQEGSIQQWQPKGLVKASILERWQQSRYVIEGKLGSLSEWRLIVEQPLAPFMEQFYALYVDQMEIIFVILMVALVCAEIFSRRVLVSVERLQVISSTLPDKLEALHDITWPTSFIREVDGLARNIKEMATLLMQKFTEIRQLNLTLEQRVEERAKAFQESEAKYRIIFENRMYAISLFDVETLRLLDVNTAFTALYGYSREELLGGMTLHDINAWGEDSDFIVQETLRSGTIFLPLRYHRKKNGTIFPLELAGGSYVWQGRRVVFIIASDITERRQATEVLTERTLQLEDLTKNLELKVKMEVARRRKNEQLLIQQAKLAAMGEMLGAIAHQWRQPLNSLALCIQNIKDSYRYGELSQDYLDRTVQESMVQVDHMSRTIDDFRHFFQPNKDLAPFDTMQAVTEVLSLISPQFAAHGITFSMNCCSKLWTFDRLEGIAACPSTRILGYKNEFEHVILNLVDNAKDAIGQRRAAGQMAADEKGVISFDFENIAQTITITVGDNGGGIPAPLLDRIFEPYFSTKEPGKGTGIGLYLSKTIIEEHLHGSLSVQNGEQGATFVLVLPTINEAHADEPSMTEVIHE